MLIGLTGKYCAGKNFIANLLENRGFSVLDVDKLGHEILENKKEEIFAKFGTDLRRQNGSLDRKLLGEKVFNNKKKLASLENLVHPEVNRLTEEWISACGKGDSHLIVNAALLHRSSVFNQFDRIILVKAPFFTRLFRAIRRDKLSIFDILKRFAGQKDFDSQYSAKNAEIYIIDNPKNFDDTGFTKLDYQIDRCLEGIE